MMDLHDRTGAGEITEVHSPGLGPCGWYVVWFPEPEIPGRGADCR